LKASRQLLSATASFTLTGYDTALAYSGAGGKTLTASTASFALTGNDAGLSSARKVTAATASYSLTGNDAALTYTPHSSAYTLTAESGSFTLTLNDATLAYSGAVESKPPGAPGKRIKFNGKTYDSIKDRHRIAQDVSRYLADKEAAQKSTAKPKKIKTSVAKISAPKIEIPEVEIDELQEAMAAINARAAQLDSYIDMLRTLAANQPDEDEEFLMMIA
jgi:hypothetical protein